MEYDFKWVEKTLKTLEHNIHDTQQLVKSMYDVHYVLGKVLEELKTQNQIASIKESLSLVQEQLDHVGIPKINLQKREFDHLKELLKSEAWAPALPAESLDNSFPYLTRRAENILTLLVRDDIRDTKFLDFGCGKGFETVQAHAMGAHAVGYDISPAWQFESDVPFFSSWDDVKKEAPFDIILAYDVLDHCEDPQHALFQMRNVLASDGKVYLRNHPWCSRHGGHVYTAINKAFAHLVFDEDDLAHLGVSPVPEIVKVTNPLETYKMWFENMGFEIGWHVVVSDNVEPFFAKEPAVARRLTNYDHMDISFVDYMIKPKSLPEVVL